MDRIKFCKSARESVREGGNSSFYLWKCTKYLILYFQQLILETISILCSEIYTELTLCINPILKAFLKGKVREKLSSLKHLYQNTFVILTLHLLSHLSF